MTAISISSARLSNLGRFHAIPIKIFRLLAILCTGATPLLGQTQTISRLDSANRLFERGQYADAERALLEILKQPVDAPTRGKATFNLGLTLQKLGRHDEAIRSFRGLLMQPVDDKEPGGHLMEVYRNYRPRAQWEVGNSLFAKKDYSGALQAYRMTKEKHPFQSWCGNERAEYEYRYEFYAGLCLDRLGKPAEAVRQYYRAAFLGRFGYSSPDVYFRVLDIYEEAGQFKTLLRLLDEIDADLIQRAKSEAAANGVKFDEQQLRKIRPTQFMRRILELRSLAKDGLRSDLIKLLRIQSSVTGPPDDLGNWQAVESARLLALTPDQSVPELMAAAQTGEPDERWIAYALGKCGGTEALAWLKQRASREENYWAVRSYIYAISLAGKEGTAVLDSMQPGAKGNLKVALVQQKDGLYSSGDPFQFPKVSIGTRLPQSISELQ